VSEPRWLTDDEQRAWRRLVTVLTKLPGALDRQLQRDADLTQFEYFVLAMLSESPDHTLQLRDLAAQANASLSRLSHVVKRLEHRGWVERAPCPGDARATNAVLTPDGWDKVVATAPGHVEEVRRLIFDALDDQDVAAVERACGRIADRLE
jgi:DNA-binding MarR family transcriptional regulator